MPRSSGSGASPAELEVGKIYEGTVVKVMEFGAFVNFFGAKDGLVHVSQMARERVKSPSDVVKEGDKVKVKLLGFDDRGKVRLSMKLSIRKPVKTSANLAMRKPNVVAVVAAANAATVRRVALGTDLRSLRCDPRGRTPRGHAL